MRYRALDSNGDYNVGTKAVFLINTPAAVAQAVQTRLNLAVGEWFLDDREGLDLAKILGVRTQSTRDFEIQQRILGTPGVKSIINYQSNESGRAFSVVATIDTIYGPTQITGTY